MRLKRSVELERELKTRISDVYHATYCYARTHEAHIEDMKRHVWDTPEYRRSPRWLKSALHGVDSCLFDSLYRPSINGFPSPLTWVLVGTDGERYGEKDDRWLERDSAYKSSMKGDHVWRHRWEKGEWRPW